MGRSQKRLACYACLARPAYLPGIYSLAPDFEGAVGSAQGRRTAVPLHLEASIAGDVDGVVVRHNNAWPDPSMCGRRIAPALARQAYLPCRPSCQPRTHPEAAGKCEDCGVHTRGMRGGERRAASGAAGDRRDQTQPSPNWNKPPETCSKRAVGEASWRELALIYPGGLVASVAGDARALAYHQHWSPVRSICQHCSRSRYNTDTLTRLHTGTQTSTRDKDAQARRHISRNTDAHKGRPCSLGATTALSTCGYQPHARPGREQYF